MRLLILIILIYLCYRVVKGLVFPQGKSEAVRGGKDVDVIDEMVKDPVCETYVPSRDAVRRRIHGQDYYFCSKACADKFEAEQG